MKVIIQAGSEMDGVTMRQTMQAAILMVVTAVEQMSTPNGVMNVFVINKLECLKDCCVLIL